MSTSSRGQAVTVEEQVEQSGEEGTIVTLARRQFPQIAPHLTELERLMTEQRALDAAIDRLQVRNDRIEEKRAKLTTEIRDHITTE